MTMMMGVTGVRKHGKGRLLSAVPCFPVSEPDRCRRFVVVTDRAGLGKTASLPAHGGKERKGKERPSELLTGESLQTSFVTHKSSEMNETVRAPPGSLLDGAGEDIVRLLLDSSVASLLVILHHLESSFFFLIRY
ncbi:hypothetical protein BS78_02G171100 [Paspalum vaginatum]|nr:hypothetical protein BS78_02G171100 [Paspalum vaginatum]